MSQKKRPKNMSELGRRGAAATVKKFWLDDPSRPKPSLARVAWLERPDPLEPEKKTAG